VADVPSYVESAVDDRVDVVQRGDGHAPQGNRRGYIERVVEGKRVQRRKPEIAGSSFANLLKPRDGITESRDGESRLH